MPSTQIQARHVFHPATSGWDRIHAWQEATGEPAFIWGRRSHREDAAFFGGLKRAFSQWIEQTGPDLPLTIYHDGIGADVLGPLDPAPHKALYLHHWFPRWERHFEWFIRSTGKIMVGSADEEAFVRNRFAWVPERFIQHLPQPQLGGNEAIATRSGAPKKRTGIWLHGRRWRLSGNRLRAVTDRWKPEDGQLEIIADGKRPPRWARKENLVWSPDMPLEFALHRLFTWDSVLLLNDFALDSPWLLRALALGCFPLVPDGENPARSGPWREPSAPQPYPWGDTAAAIDLLNEWRAAKPDLKGEFQAWARSLLSHHPMANSFATPWASARKAVLEQRPPSLRSRKPPRDWHSVGWYERLQRFRSGY